MPGFRRASSELASRVPEETLQALWAGVVAEKVNLRRADELRVIQRALSERLGALEEPQWLQRMGTQSAPAAPPQEE